MRIKQLVACFCGVLLYCTALTAQSGETNLEYIDTLIKNLKFEVAEEKLNEILSKNANDSGALMYKGILIFYRDSQNRVDNGRWDTIDNIYEPNYERTAVENSTLSIESARQIAAYFLKALDRDPSQMNIQFGLCFAYAKAGMIDELVARFAELKKNGSNKGRMQNHMSEYAQVIAREVSLEAGVSVFEKILELYPHDGDVLFDLGTLFFENGIKDKAMKYFYEAESSGSLDSGTMENLLLIYSITGEYDRVRKTAHAMGEASKDNTELVYQALEERLVNKAEWTDTINDYLRQNNPRKDVNQFASSLRKSTKVNTIEKFLETLQHNVPAPMLAMNYEWGLKQYPGQFETLFNYAEFLTYYNHYEKALAIYRKIIESKINMSLEQREEFNFYYAWALHKSGQNLKSQQYWKPLLESSNFYKKSAASFFLGRYYFDKKDFNQASKYFSYVKDKPDKSKYAEFCLTMFKKINQ